MTDKLKEKIAKIMALIDQGATEGEKAAAKKALERIIAAHNIDESQLSSVLYKEYAFKFSNTLEKWLVVRVSRYFYPGNDHRAIQRHYKRISLNLMYE